MYRFLLTVAMALVAVDEQGLGGVADGALLVVEGGVGQADAGGGGGGGLEGDPLAGRGAEEVDGEVGVDEAPSLVVEGGADAVAGVGGDQDPAQRRGGLAGEQGVAH